MMQNVVFLNTMQKLTCPDSPQTAASREIPTAPLRTQPIPRIYKKNLAHTHKQTQIYNTHIYNKHIHEYIQKHHVYTSHAGVSLTAT